MEPRHVPTRAQMRPSMPRTAMRMLTYDRRPAKPASPGQPSPGPDARMRRRRFADAPLPAPVVHDGLQQPRRAPASLPAEDDDIGIGVARVPVPDDQSKCVVAVPGRDVQPGLESSRRRPPRTPPPRARSARCTEYRDMPPATSPPDGYATGRAWAAGVAPYGSVSPRRAHRGTLKTGVDQAPSAPQDGGHHLTCGIIEASGRSPTSG